MLTITPDKTLVAPGGTIVYRLTLTNTTDMVAENIIIRVVVPMYTTYNARQSTPGWELEAQRTRQGPIRTPLEPCFDGNPAGTICTATVTQLDGGAAISLDFAVTLDLDIPLIIHQITLETAVNGQELGGEFADTTIVMIEEGTRLVAPIIANNPVAR